MLQISELAAGKVKEIMAAQNQEDAYLRVYLVGAGWSGPSFGLALDESTSVEDQVDEVQGVKLVAEKKYAQYLEGAVIDFTESELGSGFQIITPSMSDGCSSCSSCGD